MKHLTLSLLLLCGMGSFAQTGFIEVTVMDTVWMKPTSFEYIVEIADTEGWAIYPPLSADSVYNEGASDAEKQQQFQDLKAFLTKKKYVFHVPEKHPKGLESYYIPDGIIVTLKSARELQKLETDLKTFSYVTGQLRGGQFPDEAVYDAAIYTKLVNRARARAQAIGNATGQKPGKVLEVTEIESKSAQDINIYDIYFVFNNGRVFEDENGDVHGELTRTLIIKFATE